MAADGGPPSPLSSLTGREERGPCVPAPCCAQGEVSEWPPRGKGSSPYLSELVNASGQQSQVWGTWGTFD